MNQSNFCFLGLFRVLFLSVYNWKDAMMTWSVNEIALFRRIIEMELVARLYNEDIMLAQFTIRRILSCLRSICLFCLISRRTTKILPFMIQTHVKKGKRRRRRRRRRRRTISAFTITIMRIITEEAGKKNLC